MPKFSDFDRLCDVATMHGWLVGLTVADFVEQPRDGRPGRRTLGFVRLKRNKTAPAKFAVPVGDDLNLAARQALDLLLAHVNEPGSGKEAA
jgi:hypothetical protein